MQISDEKHGRGARATLKSKIQNKQVAAEGKVAIVVGGRIKYIDRPGYVAPKASEVPAVEPALERVPRPKAPKEKIDPKYLAAGRELRDRYLEQFNSGLVLPGGKYEVSKALPQPTEPAFGYNPKSLPVAA